VKSIYPGKKSQTNSYLNQISFETQNTNYFVSFHPKSFSKYNKMRGENIEGIKFHQNKSISCIEDNEKNR